MTEEQTQTLAKRADQPQSKRWWRWSQWLMLSTIGTGLFLMLGFVAFHMAKASCLQATYAAPGRLITSCELSRYSPFLSKKYRAEVRTVLGTAYAETGEDEHALSNWAIAMEFPVGRRTRADLHYRRAMIFKKHGKHQDWFDEIDAAIRNNRDFTEYFLERAWARVTLGGESPAALNAAKEDLAEVLKWRGSDPSGLLLSAIIEARLENWRTALRNYDIALRFHPIKDHQDLHLQRLLVLLKTFEFAQVIEETTPMIDLEIATASALVLRSYAFCGANHFEDAWEDIDTIARDHPDTLRRVQRGLPDYTGPVHGKLDAQTRAAVRASFLFCQIPDTVVRLG